MDSPSAQNPAISSSQNTDPAPTDEELDAELEETKKLRDEVRAKLEATKKKVAELDALQADTPKQTI